MFCGALNSIIRKKSKLVCNLLVSEELDGGRLLLRLVPSSVLLCGLLGRKTQVGRTPLPIADGVCRYAERFVSSIFIVCIPLHFHL